MNKSSGGCFYILGRAKIIKAFGGLCILRRVKIIKAFGLVYFKECKIIKAFGFVFSRRAKLSDHSVFLLEKVCGIVRKFKMWSALEESEV